MTPWKLRKVIARSKGLCPTCCKRQSRGQTVTCSQCTKAANARRERWRADGLCVDCRTVTGGTRRCIACNRINTERYG